MKCYKCGREFDPYPRSQWRVVQLVGLRTVNAAIQGSSPGVPAKHKRKQDEEVCQAAKDLAE